MDIVYENLFTQIQAAALQKPDGRMLVGISGPPGCGKSTIAENIVRLLNSANRSSQSEHFAAAVSVDGFHLTRKQLCEMENSKEAFARRGAPWTFDVDAILAFVEKLRDSGEVPNTSRATIYAPSFDHVLKDPVENDVIILPETKIVILEHNYLLLDQEKWRDISNLLDLRIFVNVDAEVARERVAGRHVHAGIEPTLKGAYQRFDLNDGLNGHLIRSNITKFDVVVDSVSM